MSDEVKEEINEEIKEDIKEESKEEKKADKKSAKAEKKVNKELEKAKEEAAEAKDRWLRTVAEFDNYKKRTLKELDSRYSDGKADLIEKLLSVIDNFERAMDTESKDEAYKEGVVLIFKQFTELLEKEGVKEIEALGKSFDPNLHNAVMHIDDENAGENEIVEVFQKGYIQGDKVIRHSMVKVAN